MLHLLCNKKGVSMAEVLIAIFITSVGIFAVLSLQPQAWQTAAKADFMGRAAELMYSELEIQGQAIMNPCVAVVAASTSNTVQSSGQAAAVPSDVPFTVQTTITNIGTSIWRVTVRVTWPGNAIGVTANTVVTRQERFRFPAGCPSV